MSQYFSNSKSTPKVTKVKHPKTKQCNVALNAGRSFFSRPNGPATRRLPVGLNGRLNQEKIVCLKKEPVRTISTWRPGHSPQTTMSKNCMIFVLERKEVFIGKSENQPLHNLV